MSKKADISDLDLCFLPESLTRRCFDLIEKYHSFYGYRCLPDLMWRANLGPLIEKHEALRRLLHKASKARSAKKAREGFTWIATIILTAEMLASGYEGWKGLYPEAAEKAQEFLKRGQAWSHYPLINVYLYSPPKMSCWPPTGGGLIKGAQTTW